MKLSNSLNLILVFFSLIIVSSPIYGYSELDDQDLDNREFEREYDRWGLDHPESDPLLDEDDDDEEEITDEDEIIEKVDEAHQCLHESFVLEPDRLFDSRDLELIDELENLNGESGKSFSEHPEDERDKMREIMGDIENEAIVHDYSHETTTNSAGDIVENSLFRGTQGKDQIIRRMQSKEVDGKHINILEEFRLEQLGEKRRIHRKVRACEIDFGNDQVDQLVEQPPLLSEVYEQHPYDQQQRVTSLSMNPLGEKEAEILIKESPNEYPISDSELNSSSYKEDDTIILTADVKLITENASLDSPEDIRRASDESIPLKITVNPESLKQPIKNQPQQVEALKDSYQRMLDNLKVLNDSILAKNRHLTEAKEKLDQMVKKLQKEMTRLEDKIVEQEKQQNQMKIKGEDQTDIPTQIIDEAKVAVNALKDDQSKQIKRLDHSMKNSSSNKSTEEFIKGHQNELTTYFKVKIEQGLAESIKGKSLNEIASEQQTIVFSKYLRKDSPLKNHLNTYADLLTDAITKNGGMTNLLFPFFPNISSSQGDRHKSILRNIAFNIADDTLSELDHHAKVQVELTLSLLKVAQLLKDGGHEETSLLLLAGLEQFDTFLRNNKDGFEQIDDALSDVFVGLVNPPADMVLTLYELLNPSDIDRHGRPIELSDKALLSLGLIPFLGVLSESEKLIQGAKALKEILGQLVIVLQKYGKTGLTTIKQSLAKKGKNLQDMVSQLRGVSKEGGEILDFAGKIRGKMSNLGEAIPGTTIPKYFRLKTEGAEFFVNPNATKHMGEYIKSLPTSHDFPLRNDVMLASFESGVKDAVKSGAWKTSLDSGKPIVSGGWELIFAKRPSDELIVIKHALMIK